ncbi:hypothetical protein ABID65_006557 [Bradyrhizobium sp. S3.9.2]|uniref:hypothetical protein n=1 Tax=Bradyrhizobium sp. S3.9.2 TaxID=3156432 RepID=UPI00339A38E6
MLHLLVNEKRFAAALRARDALEGAATTEDIATAASDLIAGFCDRWLGPEKRARDGPRRR